jgi:hypothetical protein
MDATTTVYCPLCGKDVPFTETQAPLHAGEAPLPDAPQALCLGFGEQCSGVRCPVSGALAVVMGVQLAKSGLEPETGWRTVHQTCDGCGNLAQMKVIDDLYASCEQCGTTNCLDLVDR